MSGANSSAGQIPTIGDKRVDRSFLNPFLHAQFIVQKVVRHPGSISIEVIDANSVAVPIRADKTNLKIGSSDFFNPSSYVARHCF